ncbi:MAG TPA: hypothetical protein VIJ04_19995 [Xanthobacteraceae bacterium]
MRDRFQEAVAIGEKNQRTLELLHNWCGHVRVRKHGGVGMVEQMTGLPIGHHFLECQHAPPGGMAAWDLAETALDFHDRNCMDCKFRKAMGFPTLSVLLAEREQQRSKQRSEQDRQAKGRADRLAAREAARQRIRVALDAVEITTLESIAELDREEDGAGQRLVQTATLAPETFTPEIVDHLFQLVESSEHHLVGPSLETLTHLQVDQTRLCNVALLALRSYALRETAGAIVEKHCAEADETLMAGALPALISLANPPPSPFSSDGSRLRVVGPLQALYSHHKNALQTALKEMTEDRHPYTVRLAARGLATLLPSDKTLSAFLVPELVAKLVRANRLLEGRPDEIEETLNDIRAVLVQSFKADPSKVDQLIQDFLIGASDGGAAELYKIYDKVLHARRFGEKKQIPITEAHRVAFRRLVVAAAEATTDEVRDATSHAFHGEPYDLAPVAAEEIDLLLGSAAVLDGKLTALNGEKVTSKDESVWERQARRQHLLSLLESFVRWACISAAKAGQTSLEAVLKILRSLPDGSERLIAAIIGNFPAMMRTTEGLIACLPDFYSAQVGASPLVRSYAATAMGEMRGTTHDNLPSLAYEAFCAQLSDPYLIVHKAAIRALDRFDLPEEYDARARTALSSCIVHYANERPTDDFLVGAIDLYARSYVGKERMARNIGARLVAMLKKAKPYLSAKEIQYANNVYFSATGYADLLCHVMNDRDAMDIYHEDLIERLAELPPQVVLEKRAELMALGAKWFLQYRLISGVVIELLTSSGAWSDAATFAKSQHDGVEDNTRNTQLRLHLALRMIACSFEAAVESDDLPAIGKLSKEFRFTLAEIERDNAANEDRRDPLRGIRRQD